LRRLALFRASCTADGVAADVPDQFGAGVAKATGLPGAAVQLRQRMRGECRAYLAPPGAACRFYLRGFDMVISIVRMFPPRLPL